jgi:hypothetical protein
LGFGEALCADAASNATSPARQNLAQIEVKELILFMAVILCIERLQ